MDIIKLSNPSELPTNNALGTAFSPDGNYLSVCHYDSPFITIYKRSGDTFTKLPNPSTLPTGNGYGTAFSPDGSYLSVTHVTSPYITIYKRDGDTFTKLPNPSTLPTGIGVGTAFSPDGNYLSVAHTTSPFITIYKRNGDTFTKLPNPSVLPTSNGNGTAFSPDGNYLSVAHSASPFITIYKSQFFSRIVKSLIKITDSIKTLNQNNKWVDITNNPPSSSDFQTNGISDLSIIPAEKWNELSGTIKILTWTDDDAATSSTITYTQTQYPEKTLELTVPEHRLIDQLDAPISIVTYTDAETAPSLLQQYDYPNIGARILKRG